jgi:hypothetical protein
MKLASLAFLAFVAALAFLVLFIADRERDAGVQRLSDYEVSSRPGLDRTQPANTVKNP